MHIPSTMLNGPVCPVTISMAAIGLSAAAYYGNKQEAKPTPQRFASISSLIFALQMLNFPVQNGTSGHLIGAMLAVVFLGIPFGILSMSIVLIVQAVFFADGGINTLGANILNMSFIGAGLGGFIYKYLLNKKINKNSVIGICSFISVTFAAFICSIELAISKTISFDKVMPAMISIHTLIGVCEAIITIFFVYMLAKYDFAIKNNENVFALGTFLMAFFAGLLSPFASSFPDGLEWVSESLSFNKFSGFPMNSVFSDYSLSSGIAGIILIFCFSFIIQRSFNNV